MENNTAKFRRKQYFIATRFQVKYIGLILLLIFLTAALCSYVVYYTSMISMGEKLASVYPQGRLMAIVSAVNIRILFSLIIITPLVAMIGLFLSHRIAGPIYRMERFLNDVAGGDLTQRLTLRKKDELINLANGINNVVDSLKKTVIVKKGHLEKISMELEKLKKAIEAIPIDKPTVSELVKKVSSEADGIKNELKRYKI